MRLLLYLAIKELSRFAQDIMMVTSSLIHDINSVPQYRAEALRALGTVVDPTMISGIERLFKQTMSADKNSSVISSVFCTAIHLYRCNEEVIRRWSPEINAATQAVTPRTTSCFHALGLLYLIKQHDRVALRKLVQSFQGGTSHVLAVVLSLRIYTTLLASDTSLVIDLKPFLRLRGKNEIVALEAARIICRHYSLYPNDIVFAISTLQLFLSSKNSVQKFSALRILNEFASSHHSACELVATCNAELEGLIADNNRSVAALAVTTLLKTGKEASVESLISQIEDHFEDIGDEFRTSIIQAVHTLGAKFPAKIEALLSFLGSTLREEGDFRYKSAAVAAVSDIASSHPKAKYNALLHLCDFIEDSEYPALTSKVLHLLGDESCKISNPSRLIRYIYNRLILEGPLVRDAAVGSLSKIAMSCPSLKNGILSIIRKDMGDRDDVVRDRVITSIDILSLDGSHEALYQKENVFELDSLEEYVLTKLQGVGADNELIEFNHSSLELTSANALLNAFRAQQAPLQVVPLTATQVESLPITTEQANAFSLGSFIFTSRVVQQLTEAECEYSVCCRKHFYQKGLLLEFRCRNTVREIQLRNLTVSTSLVEGGPDNFAGSTVIDKLSFNEEQSCFTPFAIDWSNLPELAFSCILCFDIGEVGAEEYVGGSSISAEKFQVQNVSVLLADYMSTKVVINFDSEWNSFKFDEKVTLELSSVKSVREARAAIIELIGMEPINNNELNDPNSSISILAFTGEMVHYGYENEQFGLKVRLAHVSGRVVAEITARSSGQDTIRRLLAALC